MTSDPATKRREAGSHFPLTTPPLPSSVLPKTTWPPAFTFSFLRKFESPGFCFPTRTSQFHTEFPKNLIPKHSCLVYSRPLPRTLTAFICIQQHFILLSHTSIQHFTITHRPNFLASDHCILINIYPSLNHQHILPSPALLSSAQASPLGRPQPCRGLPAAFLPTLLRPSRALISPILAV